MNKELKFLRKFTKKKNLGGGGVRWGVRVDVNEEFFEKIHKKENFGRWGGPVGGGGVLGLGGSGLM